MSVASRLTERVVAAWRYDAGEIGPLADRAKRRHVLEHAERIISVEIEPRRCEAASKRFARAASVELHLGDAAELIPKLVAGLREAPLVWLDRHFTGGPRRG